MSAISPVSAQFSSAMTFSSGAIGAAGTSGTAAPAASGEIAAPAGALGVQTSLMMQQGNGLSNIDQLAALALMLLMSKSNDSQKSNNDDAWKMLAMMALMSGQGGQQSTFSFSQSVGDASAVYSSGAVAAGAGVNVQG
jgi:hypothetical protein